ncbi:H-NS histone family protein [Lysobacter sp. A3-1-A15]|uniref:H-NS histone family protein n=1 Tax=Novilysobacter viscosus TaxID=3098602 RepID=UPI002ED8591E
MSIDVNSLSAKELESLITKAKKRKTTLAKRKPASVVKKKLAAQAKSEGYTLAELFGTGTGAPRAQAAAGKTRKARKPLGKVAPKYRNPSNPDETWTGRGKQPRWLAAYTSAGRSVDEFKIK